MSKYDEKKILILQRNNSKKKIEDITTQVEAIKKTNKLYKVKYTSGDQIYNKSFDDIKIYEAEKTINLANYIVYHENTEIKKASCLVVFEKYVKIIFDENKKSKLYNKDSIKILKDISKTKKCNNLLAYLNELSLIVSNNNENKYFLKKQLNSINVLEESILGKILTDKLEKSKDDKPIIAPFSINNSQKEAISKAMSEDISIIQGPPGTGKTQTILNIIANCIYRGNSIAILSGNNEAVKNVHDKIEGEGYGYLNAFLGNSDNVKTFFKEQKSMPLIKNDGIKIEQLEEKLNAISLELQNHMKNDADIHKINQLIREYSIEKEINNAEYNIIENNIPKFIKDKNYTTHKLLKLSSKLESMDEEKITSFFNRARLLFRYGKTGLKKIEEDKEFVVACLKNSYYANKINDLKNDKKEKTTYLNKIDLDSMKKDFMKVSRNILDRVIYEKFNSMQFCDFNDKNYKFDFLRFIDRFPIIYSTTNAIKSCTQNHFLYDYIIIDEASQVSIITAIIAFSCAKKIVLVGDSKQLPHVVKNDLKDDINEIFKKYDLEQCFDYSNSILDCILKKIPDVSNTLLKEHYRCDPEIIDFCNKRFYNNQLIINREHEEGNGIDIIKHKPHYQRGRENERQADIMIEEIMPKIKNREIGVVTPFRDQVNLLNEKLYGYNCLIDTVHKFQGKEKDIIILSTVENHLKISEDNEDSDFLNNPNLINVAISRAVNKLYIIASEKLLMQKGSLIKDLSNYYEYYCSETKVIDSNVYSVFDLLYDDYSPYLEKLNKKLVNKSKFKSENIIATLIEEICESQECGAIKYRFNYPLKNVIKLETLTNEADRKFVSNINTHCDFLIYDALNKMPRLVVEVDGSQHKKEEQKNRDLRKDRLLKEAGIKILRLPTTTTKCKEKIIAELQYK